MDHRARHAPRPIEPLTGLVARWGARLGHEILQCSAGGLSSLAVALRCRRCLGPKEWPSAPCACDHGARDQRSDVPSAAMTNRRITFLGHATVLAEIDRLRVLTDPVLGSGIAGLIRRHATSVPGHLFDDIDAVFISHGHHDHLDVGSLRRIPGRPSIIVPRGLGRVVSGLGLGPVHEVAPGDTLEIDSVAMEFVAAAHDGRRLPWRPPNTPIGMVIRGSASIYFAGDTDLFDGMRAITDLDAALLPVWGWGPNIGPGHLDPERAARAAAVMQPRVAIPIHWGTFYPAGLRRLVPGPLVDPGPAFMRAMTEHAPEVAARLLAPGETLDLADDRLLRPGAPELAAPRR